MKFILAIISLVVSYFVFGTGAYFVLAGIFDAHKDQGWLATLTPAGNFLLWVIVLVGAYLIYIIITKLLNKV